MLHTNMYEVKLSLCLTNELIMKTYGGVDVILTLALDRGEWSASRPGRVSPGIRALATHLIGGWLGTRTIEENNVVSTGNRNPTPRPSSP
jgi:hypothetical protein